MTNMKRVCYVYPPAYHYRMPFNERLHTILEVQGVEYLVIYSDLGKKNRFKNDTVEIPWGKKVKLTRAPLGFEYQHAFSSVMRCDLVIMQQESRLAINYFLQIASILRIKKVAFFGHGRNFQSRSPNSAGERLKRFLATKVDWWFGYTNETRRHIASLGFPADRITVFNNAVDTTGVRRQVAETSADQLTAVRRELHLVGNNVCVLVGSLYEDRRLPFLIQAADLIRNRVPDFELVIVGGGDQLMLIQELAAVRPWVKVTGPCFGADKVKLMMLGKLFLMPGLVGLAVVDAGAAGLPTVTTAFPYHSPEIAYIEHGVNGLIVSDWQNPAAYADAVAALLQDTVRIEAMREGARHMAAGLTIEAMAQRFADGVMKALAS